MSKIQTSHNILTSSNALSIESAAIDFAKELNWSPSYFVEPNDFDEQSYANGHLVVEYGLENAATISFIKLAYLDDLSKEQENKLLAFSYNNMIDWHIAVSKYQVRYYHVRQEDILKRIIYTKSLRDGNYEEVRREVFEQIIGKRFNPNIKPLDDVLIETIKRWKFQIANDHENELPITAYANLFNAIILIRSVEDFNKRKGTILGNQILNPIPNESLVGSLKSALTKLKIKLPEGLIDLSEIEKIKNIGEGDVRRLFADFYDSPYRFRYDFSVITRQAISRVYERYVSVLEVESETNTLFGIQTQITEKFNKKTGSFYTPEYIARFFAKYIQRNVNFSKLKAAKILEPASGSGIFLRTLLEVQFEQIVANANLEKNELIDVFKNIKAIDRDPNAVIATRLSLSLLYYIFFEELPELNVVNDDTLKWVISDDEPPQEKFDIIISNPPFVKYDEQNELDRKIISESMGDIRQGKADSYLAFVKVAIDLLNPGGLGLFVLPHSFLLAKNAQKVREYLTKEANIKVLADLSALNTFDNASVYIILLIFQKRPTEELLNTSWVMRCKSNVGRALNSVLQFLPVQEKSFTSYPADSNIFESDQWSVLSKTEYDLVNKLNKNHRLSDFLEVNQGFITGNDDVFLRDYKDIPPQEISIYKSYLPDKDMKEYYTPKKSEKLVFFPYNENGLIDESVLINHKGTWAHLLKYEHSLRSRSGLKPDKSNWWVPNRMRFPNINKPKLIMPHLGITPKFSVDIKGEYAVSRAPFITLKEENDETLLYFFNGIMNSSVFYWYLSLHSHKYGSGYNMIEVATLKPVPVPSPFDTKNMNLVSKMIELVKKRITAKDLHEQLSFDQKINNLSFELYNLTEDEIKFFTDGL